MKSIQVLSLASFIFVAGQASAAPNCNSARVTDLATKAVKAIVALSTGRQDANVSADQNPTLTNETYHVGVSAAFPRTIGSDSYSVEISSSCQIYKVEYTGSLE